MTGPSRGGNFREANAERTRRAAQRDKELARQALMAWDGYSGNMDDLTRRVLMERLQTSLSWAEIAAKLGTSKDTAIGRFRRACWPDGRRPW